MESPNARKQRSPAVVRSVIVIPNLNFETVLVRGVKPFAAYDPSALIPSALLAAAYKFIEYVGGISRAGFQAAGTFGGGSLL
jgi:hypothetical protein